MASHRLVRRISAALGGAAIIVMVGFTAVRNDDSDEPTDRPTTITTNSLPRPTGKSMGPTTGEFMPLVTRRTTLSRDRTTSRTQRN